MSSIPTLKPRLVNLTKPPGVASYGFNVTATRTMQTRHIGIVMDNSLAKQAGLRSGDRVCEVNGKCCDGILLPEIQSLIVKGGPCVQLLVADPMTDQLYRDNREVIRGGLPETIVIRRPDDLDVQEPVPPSPPVLFNGQQEEVEMEAEVVDADDFMSSQTVVVHENSSNPVHTNGAPSFFKARLCTVKRWPDYSGYGFELHGDKEEGGQSIGKVESGSPAEAAGLREDDRLIEVNRINVEGEFQQAVVNRIASGPVPGETVLLVADPDALRFFRGHGISVDSSMTSIEQIETPARCLVPVRDSAGKVRLCHVKKWSDSGAYGFVLHGEKGVPGTTLSVVDPGSPADAAGLRTGDKIIEINGVNVEGEEQPQAIARIQMGVDGDVSQTRLLVVDQASELYFKRQGVFISGSMADVVYMTNPERPVAYQPHLPDYEQASDLLPEEQHPVVTKQSSSPKARLCKLKKWESFEGYGFYLHSEEGVPGIFIGKVDLDSPAEASGLRSGDRIIEVNGHNAEDDTQEDLAKKVVAIPNETQILVVDDLAYRHFLSQGVLVNSHMGDLEIFEAITR